MTVIRVNKTKNYTIMSNEHFRVKEMSLKAKGLLSLMLSLPNDWDYSVSGLVAICVEKETAINATLKELKKFGYLRVDKIMPDKTKSGRIEYVYNIFESAKQTGKKQALENLPLEFLGVEKQALENQGQLNNNNKILNNKINNNKVSKGRAFTPPTFEEIEEYAISRGYQNLAKKFFEYYTTGDWRDSKGIKIKNWKQKFITWEGDRTQTKKPEPKNSTMRAYSKNELQGLFQNVDEMQI